MFKKNCIECKNARSITKRTETNCKNRGIKGYKSMYIDKVLSMLNASEPIKKQYQGYKK